MATVLARDATGNIASIEDGKLIVFNPADGTIKLEIPFQKAGDMIDILITAQERFNRIVH
jgi:hypothetical protein